MRLRIAKNTSCPFLSTQKFNLGFCYIDICLPTNSFLPTFVVPPSWYRSAATSTQMRNQRLPMVSDLDLHQM